MRNPYKCRNQNCKESFKWPMQLNRHRKKCTHKPPDIKYVKTADGMFKCNLCFKTFIHQSGVCKHVKKNACQLKGTPRAPKSYVCSTCGNEFTHQCRLNQHMKSHDNSNDGNRKKFVLATKDSSSRSTLIINML